MEELEKQIKDLKEKLDEIIKIIKEKDIEYMELKSKQTELELDIKKLEYKIEKLKEELNKIEKASKNKSGLKITIIAQIILINFMFLLLLSILAPTLFIIIPAAIIACPIITLCPISIYIDKTKKYRKKYKNTLGLEIEDKEKEKSDLRDKLENLKQEVTILFNQLEDYKVQKNSVNFEYERLIYIFKQIKTSSEYKDTVNKLSKEFFLKLNKDFNGE